MKNTQILSKQSMICALYVVLSVVFAPLSFGALQMRISEILCVLPLFSPYNIIGITLGCFLSNLVGVRSGANVIGVIDIVVGTSATLTSAVLTYILRDIRYKGMPLISLFMPVIINAIAVGLELTLIIFGHFEMRLFIYQSACIFISQTIVCVFGGSILYRVLDKNNVFSK